MARFRQFIASEERKEKTNEHQTQFVRCLVVTFNNIRSAKIQDEENTLWICFFESIPCINEVGGCVMFTLHLQMEQSCLGEGIPCS